MAPPIRCRLLVDLGPALGGRWVVGYGVGHDGAIYAAARDDDERGYLIAR
jgi:hypothetical protein